MASSGSVNFSITRNDLVNAAAIEAKVVPIGHTLTADVQAHIIQSLNMLVKQWQGTADFAPGLKVWTRRRATLFLQKDTHKYNLGPSGDHATESYIETSLTANSAATDTTLTVDSITGISSGDNIGIVMDSGKIHWDTVNGAPSGSTVTITTGMEALASNGKAVYAYTTKVRRPVKILTATLIDSDGEEIALTEMDLLDYEYISNKTEDGTPLKYFYEAQRTNGALYTDVEPDDVTEHINFTYLSDIEDFDTATDSPDYPAEWYRALKFNLALEICSAFDKDPSQVLIANAQNSLSIAQNLYPNNSNSQDYFQPDLYC